ncbi:MAG: hypothetical protein BWK79_15700 [Beggiatoa sp. IS2]|nr:MAG: hypothetical protein BWK79_15700 [Beggiatoa sp. IS2]
MTRIKDLENQNPADLKPEDLLLYNLQRCKKLRKEQANSVNPADLSLIELSEWQSERLARTHANLLESSRYQAATRFFLTDLYAPKDFSHRDHDLERSYPMIITVLPINAVYAVALATELDSLSMELDEALAQVLSKELNVKKKAQLTEEKYAEGYRLCNNYDKRKHQIELIRILGEDLEMVVAKPFIYAALRMARIPAKFSGFGELQDFLERGFKSFHDMGEADEFLDFLVGRELRILDRIYANHPQPFNLKVPD